MIDYAQATAKFLQRGALNSDMFVAHANDDLISNNGVLNDSNKATADVLGNRFLLDLYEHELVDLTRTENQNLAIYILRKAQKNALEVSFLMKIIENVDLFKEHPDLQASCSKAILDNLKHEFFTKDAIIFNKGDEGGSYYIVLKGSVDCLIPQKIDSDTADQVGDQAAALVKTADEDRSVSEQEKPKSIESFMQVAKTYTSGGAFGEIALLTNAKRSATMKCAEDSHLMSLSRCGFDAILGAFKEYIIKERVEFLRQFGFFKNIRDSELLSLWHYMKEEHKITKTVIYAENDSSSVIYFVRSGEVQLTYLQNYNNNNESDENPVNSLRQEKVSQKRKPLVLIGQNSYFGEREITLRKPKRVTQAQCVTESQILSIDKKKLFSFLKYNDQFRHFIDDLKLKASWSNAQIGKSLQLSLRKSARLPADELKSSLENDSDRIQQFNSCSLIPLRSSQNSMTLIQSQQPQQQQVKSFDKNRCKSEVALIGKSLEFTFADKETIWFEKSKIMLEQQQQRESKQSQKLTTTMSVKEIRPARLAKGTIVTETISKKSALLLPHAQQTTLFDSCSNGGGFFGSDSLSVQSSSNENYYFESPQSLLGKSPSASSIMQLLSPSTSSSQLQRQPLGTSKAMNMLGCSSTSITNHISNNNAHASTKNERKQIVVNALIEENGKKGYAKDMTGNRGVKHAVKSSNNNKNISNNLCASSHYKDFSSDVDENIFSRRKNSCRFSETTTAATATAGKSSNISSSHSFTDKLRSFRNNPNLRESHDSIMLTATCSSSQIPSSSSNTNIVFKSSQFPSRKSLLFGYSSPKAATVSSTFTAPQTNPFFPTSKIIFETPSAAAAIASGNADSQHTIGTSGFTGKKMRLSHSLANIPWKFKQIK